MKPKNNPKQEKKIKAIIFDNNGVLELGKYSLVTFRRHRGLSIHQFMARQFNISLDQWFDSIDTPYAKSIEGKITKLEALKEMSADLGTTPEHIELLFLKAYRKYFKRNSKLFSIAYKLKQEGYKIAILSDQWHVSKEALMHHHDLLKFNEVIVSCDVGLRKPNPEIYRLVLKKLKVKAGNAVFTDNQKWNLKPAKKLGMKTALFTSNRQLIKDLKSCGVEIK